MNIHSLELVNFRNYKQASWTFPPHIIVLYGPNGVGKSNMLEALYVSTIGKSYRTNDTQDLLQFGASEAGIIVEFIKKETKQKINLRLSGKEKKDIRLNGNRILQKELMGTLNTVIFSPEDLQLIKGSPSLRRRFLDIEISQTSALYYQQLRMYNKILQQRNKVLKDSYGKTTVSLAEWDYQLAEAGSFIIKKRLDSLRKINLLLDLMNRRLTGGKENLKLTYEQQQANGAYITEADAFYEQLQANLAVDRHRMNTSFGPHRDDLGFFSGPIDLKRFGSQGQQRTAILSLKLSELEYIKSEVGEYPILLLDDVLSELDKERRQNLLQFIHKRIQTFITTTDLEEVQHLTDVALVNCERR
ncbi:DNA replication/repair protein RecF [Veillonella criceti]|uniref:DNA replication and repair protein RecF n=1 Tax=Veillonella criceti TaxID=103891 RepID=A0A380NMD8_9FIRM|nr:DNA replication/repair protein RecF [Veillonella criceti]SUP43928.1 DNA replication and repair protein recF [Veillonella criceti]